MVVHLLYSVQPTLQPKEPSLRFVPEEALPYGFVNSPGGTHGSRTIMLKELRLLLDVCLRPTTYKEFQTAIVDENAVLKRTLATRKESFRRLCELYALDEKVVLFRILRDLWDADAAAQPLLACLCAVARDALLRAGAEMILATPKGDPVPPQRIEKATEAALSTTIRN